eukprot:4053546-Pyramimonas_sp.AAC.1
MRPMLESRPVAFAAAKDGVVPDLFLGPGGVARAAKTEGFKAVERDRNCGDARDPSRQKRVRIIKMMVSQDQ